MKTKLTLGEKLKDLRSKRELRLPMPMFLKLRVYRCPPCSKQGQKPRLDIEKQPFRVVTAE